MNSEARRGAALWCANRQDLEAGVASEGEGANSRIKPEGERRHRIRKVMDRMAMNRITAMAEGPSRKRPCTDDFDTATI